MENVRQTHRQKPIWLKESIERGKNEKLMIFIEVKIGETNEVQIMNGNGIKKWKGKKVSRKELQRKR